jgi:hypothetical protein
LAFSTSALSLFVDEYKVVVPAILGYSAVRRGEHPFFIDKTKDGWGRYLIKFLSEDAYESPMSFALAFQHY